MAILGTTKQTPDTWAGAEEIMEKTWTFYESLVVRETFAKLSQAPASAGLSLALFLIYPATRPDPADPTRLTRQE